jgi:DNA-directed RNA polymerase sigma subunit (sigma70/sigma32)
MFVVCLNREQVEGVVSSGVQTVIDDLRDNVDKSLYNADTKTLIELLDEQSKRLIKLRMMVEQLDQHTLTEVTE